MLSPEFLFWIGLVVKMALTATAVVAVSIAVERSGPFVGALISALPTSVGAAYVILALEQPPQFIADGAIGTVAITAAVSVFALVYTVLAQRHGLGHEADPPVKAMSTALDAMAKAATAP